MARLLFAFALLLIAPAPTLAGGTTYGGEGALLFPLKKTVVRVVSLHISMEDGVLSGPPVPGWRVQGTYTLENPTDQDVTVTLAFPEFRCPPGAKESCATLGGEGGASFLELRTWVGFKETKLSAGRVPRKVVGGRAIRRLHTFELRFAPREVQKVRHTYRFAKSTELWSDRLSYVTSPGALWAGPIGKSLFTVRTPARPYGFSVPTEFNVLSYTEVRDENHGDLYLTDLVIEQRDWTPKGDLTLEMEPTGSAPLISGLRCPAVQEVLSRAALWLAALDRVEPLPFVRLSDEELRRCRALPRAIHGATFEDAELSAFFYEPRPIGASQKLFVSRANPGFDPSMLTAEEWLYVHVLTQVELARAARVRSVTAE